MSPPQAGKVADPHRPHPQPYGRSGSATLPTSGGDLQPAPHKTRSRPVHMAKYMLQAKQVQYLTNFVSLQDLRLLVATGEELEECGKKLAS